MLGMTSTYTTLRPVHTQHKNAPPNTPPPPPLLQVAASRAHAKLSRGFCASRACAVEAEALLEARIPSFSNTVRRRPFASLSSPTRVLATQPQSRSAQHRLPNDARRSARHIRRPVFAPHGPLPLSASVARPGRTLSRTSLPPPRTALRAFFRQVAEDFSHSCRLVSDLLRSHRARAHETRCWVRQGLCPIALRDGWHRVAPAKHHYDRVSFQPSPLSTWEMARLLHPGHFG